MKTCSTCEILKPVTDFHKDKSAKSGFRSECKQCVKHKHDNKRELLRQQGIEYYNQNKEKLRKKSREYHQNNKNKRNEQCKEYRNSFKGKVKFLFLSAKHRADKKNLEFNLTEEIISLLLTNGCAKSGIPFNFIGTGFQFRKHPFSPSIDRKNSRKGYTFDNIQIVCNMYNMGKSEHDEIDFIAMCMAVAERNSNNRNAINRLNELRNAGL